MTGPKTADKLANLIDPRFTSGYDELKQFVQFATNLDETSMSAAAMAKRSGEQSKPEGK